MGRTEDFVIAERMKRNHNQRLFPNCYFWRSHPPPHTPFYKKTKTDRRLSLALLINRG